MVRVIHTGDTHIGYRQYHSPERREDFLAAFQEVIADAIAAEVDAVVHAGDLFHDTRPDIPDLMGTVETLGRLARAEIPFLGVVGNHEGTRDRQWLDLLVDLDLATRLDARGAIIDDVTFYGLDYVPPTRRSSLEYDFSSSSTEHTALVAHGLFEPFAHADWDTAALLERSTVDFDVLLLGDNHAPGQTRVNGTWVTYCGSTERVSAAEREDRGYNIVTIDDDVRISRRTIDGIRPWEFVEVSLAGEEGVDRVLEEARSREIEDTVVIIRISGTGAEISPAKIEENLTEAGALIVRVIDERESSEEEVPSVQFADPDRAVDERLRQMELSDAGRMVDAIVRDRTIPDSTVRERVRSRMETLLQEVPTAFDRKDRPRSDGEDRDVGDSPPVEESAEKSPRSDADDQASIVEFG